MQWMHSKDIRSSVLMFTQLNVGISVVLEEFQITSPKRQVDFITHGMLVLVLYTLIADHNLHEEI